MSPPPHRPTEPSSFEYPTDGPDPMVRLFRNYGAPDLGLFVVGLVTSVLGRFAGLLPPLVLDEATSAVDTATELAIQRALDWLTEGRTTVAIAHRLSTVRDADTILVLEDGRVVERGGHDDLVAAGGLYATLWAIQTGTVDALSPAALARVERASDGADADD